MSLLRLTATPVEPKTLQDWIRRSVDLIFTHSKAEQVILFGSALGPRFDRFSDLDLVVIFSGDTELKAGERALYAKTPLFPCPVDLLCVTREEFERKSRVGGVLLIAREDGRAFDRTCLPGLQ